jgi:hypothetical protein
MVDSFRHPRFGDTMAFDEARTIGSGITMLRYGQYRGILFFAKNVYAKKISPFREHVIFSMNRANHLDLYA